MALVGCSRTSTGTPARRNRKATGHCGPRTVRALRRHRHQVLRLLQLQVASNARIQVDLSLQIPSQLLLLQQIRWLRLFAVLLAPMLARTRKTCLSKCLQCAAAHFVLVCFLVFSNVLLALTFVTQSRQSLHAEVAQGAILKCMLNG